MRSWNAYPEDYRAAEVQQILRAVCSGECAAVIGLSGSGKSNLVGFLLNRAKTGQNCPQLAPVDCNRLAEPTATAFFDLLLRAMEKLSPEGARAEGGSRNALEVLESAIERSLAGGQGVCLVMDRFDALYDLPAFHSIASNLRALRDSFKYQLTYLTAARRPLDASTELAELFFGCTVWLGPMARSDAAWSARRDLERYGLAASEANVDRLVKLSWGYPSLLRAACEAFAAGAMLDEQALGAHPAVQRRVVEFWSDRPDRQMVRLSGLDGHPWLEQPAGTQVGEPAAAGQAGPESVSPPAAFDTTRLTAKENLLLRMLIEHAGQVCEKDDLIRAVWPEDVIYEQGIRDESLAQLVRRLRVKIESDPAEPRHIHTVPGRGYLFKT